MVLLVGLKEEYQPVKTCYSCFINPIQQCLISVHPSVELAYCIRMAKTIIKQSTHIWISQGIFIRVNR